MLKADRISDLLDSGEPKTDPLVIVPKPEGGVLANSGAASVDLRLGTWFVTLRPARIPMLSINEQGSEAQLTKTHYVPFGSSYIIHPRAFVLGVTLEWIRLPSHLAGYVIGKSSWGRRGLIIATATGVHPGFRGCLTLELTNVGEVPVELHPGMSICQLCLHGLDEKRSGAIDPSKFAGRRRPRLGAVYVDSFAKKLASLGKRANS